MCDILTTAQRKSVNDFSTYANKILSDRTSFNMVMQDAGFMTKEGQLDWQRKCEDHIPYRSSDVYNAQ